MEILPSGEEDDCIVSSENHSEQSSAKEASSRKSSVSPRMGRIEGYSCTLYKDCLVFFGGLLESGEAIGYSQGYNLKKGKMEESMRGEGTQWPGFGHSASFDESRNMIIYFGGAENRKEAGTRRQRSRATLQLFEGGENGIWGYMNSGESELYFPSPVSTIWENKFYAYQANRENGNFGELGYLDKIPDPNCFIREERWEELHVSTGDNIRLHDTNGKAIWVQNKLYLFTENVDQFSRKTPDESQVIDDVYVLDIDRKHPEWQRIFPSGKAPGILSNILMIEANGVIYMFALSHEEDGEPKSVFWAYDTNEEKWKQVQDIGTLTVHPNQRAVIYKGQLLIIDWDIGDHPWMRRKLGLGDIKFASPSISGSKDICKDNPENLIQDAKDLFEGRLFSDIIFEVEGEEIPAHKAPLAYHSDYFMKMFTSGMSESHSAKISIPNMKPHIFKAILQYIYCNEVGLEEQLALDLIPVADEYLLRGLKEICEKYLCKKLRKENAIDLLIIADRHEVTELKEACLSVLKNLDEKEELAKLPNSLLVELLRRKTTDLQQKDSF